MTKIPNLARQRGARPCSRPPQLPLFAAPLPPAIPETVGLSTSRLAQMTRR